MDLIWKKISTIFHRNMQSSPVSKINNNGVELIEYALANAFNDY